LSGEEGEEEEEEEKEDKWLLGPGGAFSRLVTKSGRERLLFN
jgi:hypothetical protein